MLKGSLQLLLMIAIPLFFANGVYSVPSLFLATLPLFISAGRTWEENKTEDILYIKRWLLKIMEVF